MYNSVKEGYISSFMSVSKSAKVVHIPEEEILRQLTLMQNDDSLSTPTELTDDPYFADRKMTFVDKHHRYLVSHPKVNPEFYLSNLRTMIKIRTT